MMDFFGRLGLNNRLESELKSLPIRRVMAANLIRRYIGSHAWEMPTVRLEVLSGPDDYPQRFDWDPKYPLHDMPWVWIWTDRSASSEKDRQASRTRRQRKIEVPLRCNV